MLAIRSPSKCTQIFEELRINITFQARGQLVDDGDAHGTTGLHEAIVQIIDVVGRDRFVGLGPMSI